MTGKTVNRKHAVVEIQEKLLICVMERGFAVEQTYYCLYVRLHLLYLCVAAE
jgi:hypothetical protein